MEIIAISSRKLDIISVRSGEKIKSLVVNFFSKTTASS